MSGQLLQSSKSEGDKMPDPKIRPYKLDGSTYKVETGCGSLFVNVNLDEEGKPFEVFAQLGKAGGCASAQTQSTARLASVILRAGVPVKQVIKQLAGIRCHKPAGMPPADEDQPDNRVLSCSDAIARVLKEYLPKDE